MIPRAGMDTRSQAPSITRALCGLPAAYQTVLTDRYHRLLPVLYLLLRPSDIARRNRTWPGSTPEGKAATSYLSSQKARLAREVIQAYASQPEEIVDELWALFRAYCRYGPIGLIEALPSHLPPLVADEIQAYSDLHRLARHPRSDAGISIRPLLAQYANDLGIEPLPSFVARYVWASDRKIERWFVGDSAATEHVARTTRRVVLGQPYPHQRWLTHIVQIPLECSLSQRHPVAVWPWLIWLTDEHTGTLMGYCLCAAEPGVRDLALALRWAIWHFGASWWSARGVPDTLIVPEQLFAVDLDVQRALSYLHIKLRAASSSVQPPTASAVYVGWPESFAAWLMHLQPRYERLPAARQWTIADLSDMLLDYIQESMLTGVATRTTPTALQEQECSLPWGTGIGAVLLLPSAGTVPVRDNRIAVWGIPYDLATAMPDNTMVDVRYDPDDARQVYAVIGRASVVVATASAFEHRTPWTELVESYVVHQ